MGTEEGGSSLIGDGLASCVFRFDRLDEERARSIVFATDNALAGEPLVTLSDAAQLAAERGIRVYAVAPAYYITDDDAAELEAAADIDGRVVPHDRRRPGRRARDRAIVESRRPRTSTGRPRSSATTGPRRVGVGRVRRCRAAGVISWVLRR